MTVTDFPDLATACSRCAVRSKSLCASLDPDDLRALNAISRRRLFDPGQTIVSEGDRDLFGNVVSGLLVEKKSMADGREQIVALLFPGDFHGAGNDGIVAATTVQAVTKTMVCVFDRSAFDGLVREQPAIKQAVLDQAFSALTEAREWMLLLGQKNATERVATFLLRLARRQAEPACSHVEGGLEDGARVDIPITRAQMAAYLGLTIETVSRRLTALRDKGLITSDETRVIRLNDVAALRRTSGGFNA